MALHVRAWVVWAAVATAGTTSACDLLAPVPRRFINDAAHSPRVDTLSVRGLQAGQHVAGRLAITADLSGIADSIASVVLQVDTTIVSQASQWPWTLDLDTRPWPDGPHVVSVGVVLRAPAGGLAGAVGVPTAWEAATVVFDQSRPTPGRVDSVVWRGGHPTLFWPENGDANFYAYVVDRTGNWAQPHVSGWGVDSLFDRHTTSWVDTAIAPIYGLQLSYRVWVTNRDSTARGDSALLRYGTTVPVYWNGIARPVTSAATGETYVLAAYPSDTLMALSPAGVIVRRIKLAYPDRMVLSADGATLYVPAWVGNVVTVLDAATFTPVATWALPDGLSRRALVAGRAGRLYTTSAAGPVTILDAGTGAAVGQVPVIAPNGVLAIAPDRRTLFVLASPSSQPVVYRADVSTDTPPAPVARVTDDPRTDATDVRVSPDGTRLFICFSPFSNYVNVWDATTLATVGRLDAPEGLFDFIVGPDAVYVSEARSDPRAWGRSGRVVRYDPATLAALGSWDFVEVPQGLAATADGRTLFAFGSFATWYVPVR